MTYVAPTILVPTEAVLKERIAAIRQVYVRAQIDVLNDTFVKASSFADAQVIDGVIHSVTCEVDLMVDMSNYDLAQWNKSWVDKIAFHIEAITDPRPIIELIKSWGKKVFLSLNPDTSIGALEPYIKTIDGVLFMTVHPGRSGNPFQPQVLDAIKEFHDRHREVEIEVDGGVNVDTLPSLLSVGVSGFAVGSYLDNNHIEDRSQKLLSIIENFESHRKSRS